MSFWSGWRKLVNLGPTLSKRVPAHKPTKRRRAHRLTLEALEDRTLLSAALSLDQPAYAPGATAVITGTGFNSNDTLTLQVARTDTNSTGTRYAPLTVTDDPNGNFTVNWTLPTTDPTTAVYQVTTSGPSAADTTSATFVRMPPSVQTDKLDYAPGQTATITGSGFQAGEAVDLKVINTDTGTAAGNPSTWTVVADSQGNIRTSWTCTPDLAGANLELDATGESSGLAASETFTDSSNKVGAVALLHQNPNPVFAGNTATYDLTITRSDRSGGRGNLAINISFPNGLPAGVTYTGPAQVNLPSKQDTLTVQVTFSTTSTIQSGIYSFEIEAARSGTDVATNTATLVVGQQAHIGPTAVDDYYATTANTAVSGNVRTNDIPGSSSTLTVTSYQAPTNGTVNVSSNGSFTYIPNTGFTGIDTFTYTVTDGNALSDTGLVTISVGLNSTTTTLTSSLNPSVYGQSVTFTATVSGGSSPTGTVTFYDTFNNTLTILGLGTLNSNDQATLTVPSTSPSITAQAAGTQSIYAVYGGDSANSTSTSTTVTETVSKATPTVSVSDAGGTYRGSAFPASATVNGGSSLETVGLTLTYYQGTYSSVSQLSGLTPLSGAPTAAGAYTVVASFAGSADYTSGSALTNFTISQVAPTVTVSDNGGTYRGSAFPASATVNGGSSLETVGLTLIYYQGTYSSVSQLSGLNPLSGSPTAAGAYTVVASFAGSADYTAGSALANFTIAKATPTLSVSDAGGTYKGSAFVASDTVAGVSGTPGSSLEGVPPTLDYIQLNSNDTTTDLGSNAPVHAGNYEVLASFAGSNDYAPASASATFTITPATLTVTANAPSKVYGQSDPALTYTVSGLQFSDTEASVLSGLLARAAGENVGSYAIGQGTLAADSDYTLSFTGNNLSITPATLTVTANAPSKVYGQSDPALTYAVSGLQFSDTEASVLSGLLARAAGENVGTYAINQGNLASNANYTLSFTGNNLSITPATLTVTANAQSKVYGADDPTLTYQVSGLQFSDTEAQVLSGLLARAAGENVGTYAINQGNLASNANYSISFTGSNLTITPATLTVTANAPSKVYGQSDPTLTYQVSGLQFSDTEASVLSGLLARAAGENVGTYAINQGNLASNANYTLSFTGNNLSITPATLTVTDNAPSKVYGQSDPALTYTVSGLQFSDTEASVLSGLLARVSGENVGTYAIGQGTLASNANYTLSFTGNNLSITPATLTVTANAPSKVYGQSDPALTYAVSGLQFSDTEAQVLSGLLARAAGENVGTYAINQGNLASNANYSISFTGSNLTITPATLTVTANAPSKVYGQSDPALTYTVSGLQFSDTEASVLSGLLARAAGENVGTYAINQGNLASNANYTLSFTGNNLSITPATLTVTANAPSKVYGQSDPALTYTVSGLQFSDTEASVLSGLLARAAGENVGSYAIGQGTLAADSDYTLSFTGNNLSITPATLTVTANAPSKVYGQSDPTLTYQVSGLQFSDTEAQVLSGLLARAAGEDVGTYAINQGNLASNANYTLSFTGNNLSITPATLTVTANAPSKVYGQSDPALTYAVSGLQFSDTEASVLSGLLARAAGEDVGTYAIGQGTLNSNANYTLSFTGNNLSITPATLTVTANAPSKVYGQSDPTLTYQVSGLQFSDTEASVLSGLLARAAGEDVGTYAINQGNLASNANYTLSFTGNNLSITPATLTVTANAPSKVYGQSDPTLTYQVSGLQFSDTEASVLSGLLARAAGEDVGTYAIGQGTLNSNANYTLSFTGNNLSITPATLTVTANAPSKVYGQSDPALTYTVSGLQFSDTEASVLSGLLARAAGENVGSYAIGQGTLTADSDYTLSFTGNNLSITPATLTVTANAPSKVYGQSDPALTYAVSGLQFSDTEASVLSGLLARAAGENVGTYAIDQGTLNSNANYTLSFTGNNLSITPATLTVTANAPSKVYGQSDPALTYAVSGLQFSDTEASVLSGLLARAAGENVGTYAINQGNLASNANYTLSFTGNNLSITPATLTVTANAPSKVYGQSDPTLTYQVSGLQFSDTEASVLSGLLARAAGENVGSYAIGQGTLTADSDYTLSFTGNNLSITPATLTVTANAPSKVYGQSDPALTYAVSGLQFSDTEASVLSGLLARAAGENVGTYAIDQGTLNSNANYTLSFTGNNLSITPATLTVTANAPSKVYGQSDPALTYAVSGLQFSDTEASVLSGLLARAAGEDVGTYAINQGNLASNANYSLSFTGNNLSITPATLTVTANAPSKVYGQSDPTLTYQVSGLQFSDTEAQVLSGLLARAAGENVGTYAINQGNLASNANYTLSFTGNNLSITPATLTVTANAQSKVYGADDPTLTYQVSGLQFSDTEAQVLSGLLARVSGENVGTYGINQGNLASNANYTLSFTGSNLTITPATLTVTANSPSKVYGQSDPTLTYAVSGLQFSDTEASVLSGLLARAAGEDVGTYAINQGNLASNANYTLSFTGNNLSITPATLTVTANAPSKVYGQSDPTLTYQVSGLQFSDTEASVLSGLLARAAGEHVGTYAINQGNLASNANYTLSFTGNNLSITPATLTVTANAPSKVYGQSDPTLTYQVSGLQFSDTEASVLSGLLARAAGEDVGTYAIGQGTLNSNANYTLSFTGNNLSITPATLTVTANAPSKVYGQSDPTLTYQVSGLQFSDTEASVLSGLLARAAGEDVGTYAINQGNLASNANYTLSFTGNNLSITPATLTVTANAPSKVYGQSDPTLTYQVSGLQFSDTEASVLSGLLARAAGEDVGTYAIGQGTLNSNANYTLSFTGNNLSITPATLTVTANAPSKVYGQSDPALTYTVSGLQFSDTEASVLSGLLARAAGENVGSYAIGQGTLTADSDYTLSFTGNNLSITPATLTVTANAPSKVYGQSDPALTYAVSGLQFSDTEASVLSGLLARAAGENVGTYAIDQGTLNSNANYTLSFTGNNLSITPATLTVTANAPSKVYGQSDPALTYAVSGLQFSDTEASVLSGLLARAAGENVGTYAINQGNLASNANYTLSFTGNNLSITPATLTVTANAPSKVYGQSDPTLTYQVSGLQFSDTEASVLSGLLARAAGEHVGTYAINQGNLASNANYTLSFTGNNLSITPATLTVTANAPSKVYGQSDPTLTYQVSGLQFSDTEASVLSGLLARAAGEHVGTYAIGQGTLNSNANYTLSFTGNNLSITPATLTVTANAPSKVYGQSDPALTYAVSGLQFSDTEASVLSGLLARAAGENVGTYAIDQGTLNSNANYTLSFTGNNLSITPATLTVTANAPSKVYGQSDPALTYAVSGLQFSDTEASVLSGLLARAAGENVGTYAINQGNLASNANYTLSFTGNNLSITPATLTVTANAPSKVYGQSDPALTYAVSGLQFSDTEASVLSGLLARAAGENVGTYAIDQGTLNSNANYTLSFTGNNLSITPATLTVTANAQSKVYGADDPTLTYQVSGLQFSDTEAQVLSGLLARAAGENVGTYAINQGNLASNANYTLSFTGNNLSITPATLTVTANAPSKVYGQSDPALTYAVSGLQFSDTEASVLSGLLARAAGENVGTYAINQGNLASNANYTLSFTGNNLSITPATLTVTANAPSKVYGQSDPALTYAVSGLQFSDTEAQVLSGLLARAAGENVGTYAINQGNLASNANYTLSFTGNNLSITPATLTVTANAQSKVYGADDPTLTYQVSGLQFSDTEAQVLSGLLARVSGENVGTYGINQGNLASNANYTLSFTGSDLTISPATLTVTANAQSKVYGADDPTLTYQVSGLQFSDTASNVLTGGLTRVSGEDVGSYAISQGTLKSNGNYTIAFTGSQLTITPAATSTSVTSSAPTSTSGQSVTFTATVTNTNAGMAPRGSVQFYDGSTYLGLGSYQGSGGNAATWTFTTSTLAAGPHSIWAVYLDPDDFQGSTSGAVSLTVSNVYSSSGSPPPVSPLTIAPVAASIQFTSVTVVPNWLALNQTETIAVHVSGPGGIVNQGTVTFTVNGHSVNASVNANGDATASLTLPLLTAALPQNISAAFSGPNRSPAIATQTALWWLVDALLPAVDAFAADGSQSAQSFLFGLPLLDFLYTAQGQLTKVVFGPDWLSLDFSYYGALTVVRMDGVLPVMVFLNTPQG